MTVETISFVTRNSQKFIEAKQIFDKFNVPLKHIEDSIPEIQDKNIENIALEALKVAFIRYKTAVIVEDTGLFIHALNGFPGPYSSFAYQTLGNNGILKLMEGVDDRTAEFQTVVAFVRTKGKELTFSSVMKGNITYKIRGSHWGFDPIFQPFNSIQTYAEMGSKLKSKNSHRQLAFEKLCSWLRYNNG
jgi:XTP/dITP diphosphohydrolase